MLNNTLIAQPRNANAFMWVRNAAKVGAKTGMADASTLGYRPGQTPGEQLFADSCGFGLVVVNPQTGGKRVFVLTDTTEHDGEIYGWSYLGYNIDRNGRMVRDTNLDLFICND